MLVTGVWAVLAALAGAAGADEGPPPEAVRTSASAPVDPSSDVLVVDGEDAEPAPTDAAPPGPPEATPDVPDVPAPVAAETPPPDPQDPAAPVDEPVPPVDPSTAEPSALEHTPAGTDAVPVGTDAVPVGADVACLPTLDPTAVQAGTEETAAPAGVPDAVPGPCGGSDAPVPLVDDAAADESSGTCEDSCAADSALGPPAAPQPDTALPVDPVVSGVDELTPSAGRTAPAAPAAAVRTPAPALPTPALPAPDQPTSPIRPPAAPPVAPPVPGHGTAGGCASSVSAGGHHDGSSTVAIVDLDTVASTPSGSGRSGSGCMADVARRAIDPGSRPT